MQYTAAHIAAIVGSPSVVSNRIVENIVLDSRRIYSASNAVFFALNGERRSGLEFIPELYQRGVRCFVLQSPESPLPGPGNSGNGGHAGTEHALSFPDADFIIVPDALAALQQLAALHRSRFKIPVIGITGSNGKTVVKEWLYQLLQPEFNIVRSPRSYNSQTGVPLSVWQMNAHHTLAIFEAGISRPGEMEKLEAVIRPTIGVFTNLGEAHSEGFVSAAAKAEAKAILFLQSAAVVYNGNNELISTAVTAVVNKNHGPAITGKPAKGGLTTLTDWKYSNAAALQVTGSVIQGQQSTISASWQGRELAISIPFSDRASQENAITCWAVLLQLGYTNETIASRMTGLQAVNMRLEVKQGINGCTVINDSYSADPDSLEIALNFMRQQSQGRPMTVILSDFLQSSTHDGDLYAAIIATLMQHQVSRLVVIGPRFSAALELLAPEHTAGLVISSYPSAETYVNNFRPSVYRDQIILVKGARSFHLEEITHLLEHKMHQTVLEINLNAIVHNVKFYQSRLKPTTRIMAMVKAFAYGAGGAEIAGILEFHKVDYLGVAYADEGVELRKAGITLPIMVINPEPSSFDSIVSYNLEPDLYSRDLLLAFESFISQEGLTAYPIHLEIETGMNRLGFAIDQVEEIASRLAVSPWLRIQTVFSHLAASEDGAEDEYSLQQFAIYTSAVDMLKQKISYPFIRHISNSAAIMRLPALELDMVRLGIGLYGIDSSGRNQPLLQPAATLRTTVAQLKYLNRGATVGYNRRGVIEHDTIIATVRIGYADGYSRRLGHGVGKMFVNGSLAPVVGTVSMDMTMIDVTAISGVKEGDSVIIFGRDLPVQQLAQWAGTIPYEIMTGISQRVQRVYFEE